MKTNNLISVDARQCGAGKTTNIENGIYSRINKNLSNQTNSIVVAGSKSLQYQYKNRYQQMIVINDDNKNSSVIKDITTAMEFNFPLICITHQAYCLLEWSLLRTDYDCILDEAINGLLEEHTISITSNKFVDFKWNQHFEISYGSDQLKYEDFLEVNKFPRNEFYRLTIIGGEDNNLMLSDSYRKLTSRNKDYYITMYDYNIMQGNDSRSKTFNVYSIFTSRLFSGWKSMHIAASAFDKTQMFHVLKYNNMEFFYTHKFNKHTGNIKLHSVANTYTDKHGKINSFTWSNYKRINHREIIESFHDYVNAITNGDKILSLRNLSETSNLSNEEKLGHSVHGLNKEEWQSITNISMESALRPSNQMILFIKQVVLDGINETEMDQIITDMFSSYLFYQAIMRCKLRSNDYNNENINIFTLDYNVALNLCEYFDIDENDYEPFEVQWNKPEPIDKKERNRRAYEKSKPQQEIMEKRTPMTSTERSRLCREKKKQELLKK
jgi:hypothetical protein